MSFFYRLRAISLLLILLMLNPGPALFARNRKSDKIYKQAQAAEARKEYEQALTLYDQALSMDPSDPAYNVGSRRMRVQVGPLHMEAAKKLRESGSLMPALTEYQKAFAVDPSNALALQEIQRTSEMIERNKSGNVRPDEANLTPVEAARKQQVERMSSILGVPDLK